MKNYFPQIFGVLASFALLILTFISVRRKKLTDRFSIIWVIISLFLFIGSVWRNFFIFINKLIRFRSTVDTIFLLGIIFLLYLTLFFTIEISKLQKNLTTFAQKFTILSEKVEKILSSNKEKEVKKENSFKRK